MLFNIKNVYKNRKEFQEVCKDAGACTSQYKRLLRSKTKKDFIQVILDNFSWINVNIAFFEPKFEYVWSFKDGFAIVRNENYKLNFINEDLTYISDNEYNDCYLFCEGYAQVKVGFKWGFIRPDGSYLVEPKFDYTESFYKGFAYCWVGDVKYRLDTKGNISLYE